ncbi:lipoprotein intramolecular transacylase Lit [Citroniella saccharovorans]|uniref:lipoprotein intramolecular transacylase Lit n=1 Tax=Citroniella saccharovorans TaxID=2053367 RepID=UPI00389900B2
MIGLLFLNFENSFIIFHKIFFNNDLWLMNPNTDIMIRILTGDFFYQICIRIIIYFLIFFFYIIFIFKDNFIKF